MKTWMTIAAVLVLALAIGATASHTEWKMRVHEGATTTEFTVASIDSLTFYEAAPVAMIWIPAGNVRLGQTDIATPVHDVWVDGFWIGKYEVTNGEYAAFIAAGGYTTEAYWRC